MVAVAATTTTMRVGLILQNLYSGRTAVVMDRFDLDTFCQLVQDLNITYSYVVPPVVLLLAKSPIVLKYNLSSIRMLNSGAAPLTHELVETVWDRLKIPVKQGMCPPVQPFCYTAHAREREEGNKNK